MIVDFFNQNEDFALDIEELKDVFVVYKTNDEDDILFAAVFNELSRYCELSTKRMKYLHSKFAQFCFFYVKETSYKSTSGS